MDIEINGIHFTNDTAIYEVLNNPKFQPYGNDNSLIDIFISEQVVIDEYTFNIKAFFINKQIKIENRLEVFEKLNKFNSNYRGLSFFLLENNTVCVKSYCATGGDIHLALVMLARNMECAQELFPEFKPA